jgi:hypothetical protein
VIVANYIRVKGKSSIRKKFDHLNINYHNYRLL